MNKDGTVSPGLSRGLSSINHISAGSYDLTFNQDVGSCAWIVSRSTSFGVADFNPEVQLTAFGFKSFANPPVAPNVVVVDALTTTGSFTDQAFSLAIIC